MYHTGTPGFESRHYHLGMKSAGMVIFKKIHTWFHSWNISSCLCGLPKDLNILI